MKKQQKKSKIWVWAVVAVLLAAVVAAVFVNRGKEAAETGGEVQMLNIPFAKQGELAFVGGESGDTLSVIQIEVADNDQRRARGLMYRSSIPENAGMLFIHDEEDVQSFWMKNTYISLDMVFVNAQKEIVTIHAATAPLKEWSYVSTAPALYVVEVNAGFCSRNNIKTGDRIEFVVGN